MDLLKRTLEKTSAPGRLKYGDVDCKKDLFPPPPFGIFYSPSELSSSNIITSNNNNLFSQNRMLERRTKGPHYKIKRQNPNTYDITPGNYIVVSKSSTMEKII